MTEHAKHPSISWMDRGLCVGSSDPDLWFPESLRTHEAAEAVAACQPCPVRTECLEYALAAGIGHGVWGGIVLEGPGGRKERRQRQVNQEPRRPMDPVTRQRKTMAERDRRRRLREGAATGDLAAAEPLERQRPRKQTAEPLADAYARGRKARAS